MRVKIRLYRPHDMDLIALKQSDTYKLGIEMKKCLISYAKGDVYTPPMFDSDENVSGYIGKMYQMHLELNPKKPDEKEAIEMLQNIRPGYRCAFIKTLFRNNCLYTPLLVFSNNESISVSRNDAFYQMTKSMKQQLNTKTVHDTDCSTETSATLDTKNEEREEEPKNEVHENIEPESIPETNTNESDDFDAMFDSFSSLG